MEDYAKRYKEYMDKKKTDKSKKATSKDTPGDGVLKMNRGSPEKVVESPFEKINLGMQHDDDEPPKYKSHEKEYKPKSIFNDGEKINIHLSVNPRNIERAVFISIILILLIILFLREGANIDGNVPAANKVHVNGLAVDSQNEEAAPTAPLQEDQLTYPPKDEDILPAEVKETIEPVPTEEKIEPKITENTTQNNPTVPEKPKLTRDIMPGDVELTIDKVYFNKTDVELGKGNVYKVDMTLINSGPDLIPLIQIFVYDDMDIEANSRYIETAKPKGEVSYDSGIKEGEVKKLTTREIQKKTMMYKNNNIHVTVRVINKVNSLLLAEKEKVVAVG
jgi:hypothetical protein